MRSFKRIMKSPQGKNMINVHVKRINLAEKSLIFFISIFLFGLLFCYYKLVMPYTYGDTAFLIEVMNKLANASTPTSSILAQNAAEIKLATVDLSTYCQQGLIAAQFATDPYYLFSLHAYFILYLIAPITRVIGALNAISALTALAFISVPCIAYSYLRKAGVSIAASFLASAIIIIHPAWQISSSGQFYVDRLFIPISQLYTILLYQYFNSYSKNILKSRPTLLLVILVGVIGGLTSERNMLVIGIFSVTYALIVQTQFKRRLCLIGFSFLCLVYVYFYVHFFGGTPDIAQVQMSIFNLSRLIDAVTRPGIGEYLWFNLILLALPSVVTPRVGIAVLPVVAINCFITIGGAEKNGWATHYHSHYYGFLVAAFLIAVIGCYNDIFTRKLQIMAKKSLLPMLMCILLALSITHYKNQGIFLNLWDCYGRPNQLSSSHIQKKMFDNLAREVPAGVSVTATEWGIAAWYLRGNKVTIFPLGVGLNDYIMVQVEGTVPDIKLLSAVRYRPDAQLANECFAPVISRNYKIIAQEGNWVLFKKTTQEGGL